MKLDLQFVPVSDASIKFLIGVANSFLVLDILGPFDFGILSRSLCLPVGLMLMVSQQLGPNEQVTLCLI